MGPGGGPEGCHDSSSKGGCRKTALAALLAIAVAERGLTIACVDADPNADLSRWLSEIYEGPIIDCSDEADLHRVAERAQALAESHDRVLIDGRVFESIGAGGDRHGGSGGNPLHADRGSITTIGLASYRNALSR